MKTVVQFANDYSELHLVADETVKHIKKGETLVVMSVCFYKFHYSGLIMLRRVKPVLLKYYRQMTDKSQ